MATKTVDDRKAPVDDDRPSGVPGPHELGEARKEGLYVAIALIVLVLIGLSFWFEASQ
ncbi:MAG TPA: hypothetical protein VFU02_02900 [Polyangiaceae bacterium]|nr:hypothetical protein [Polyangiaceae bacterium]